MMVSAAEDMLRSFELRVQEQTRHAQELSARIRGAAVTVESPGGEVRVTVDSAGGLSGLQFGSAAQRVPLERLAELVLAASRQAQAKLSGVMGDLVAQVYGRDSQTAQFVAGAYAQRFATPDTGEDGGRG